MARSSSGLGRVVLNDQITGSNPVRATKFAMRGGLLADAAEPHAFLLLGVL